MNNRFLEEAAPARPKPYSKVNSASASGVYKSSRRGPDPARKMQKTAEKQNLQPALMYSPLSPVLEIAENDWERFHNESIKKYGVSDPVCEERKLLRRESKHLIAVLSLPLNNSGSKYLHIGLDPFQDFASTIRIFKEDMKAGIHFNEGEFKTLMSVLPDTIYSIQNGSFVQCDIDNYTIMYTENDCVKFIPKTNAREKFELHIAVSSLKRLLEMENIVLQKCMYYVGSGKLCV